MKAREILESDSEELVEPKVIDDLKKYPLTAQAMRRHKLFHKDESHFDSFISSSESTCDFHDYSKIKKQKKNGKIFNKVTDLEPNCSSESEASCSIVAVKTTSVIMSTTNVINSTNIPNTSVATSSAVNASTSIVDSENVCNSKKDSELIARDINETNEAHLSEVSRAACQDGQSRKEEEEVQILDSQNEVFVLINAILVNLRYRNFHKVSFGKGVFQCLVGNTIIPIKCY